MKTCPTCGNEFVALPENLETALPENLETLGSEWLELKTAATEIKDRLKLLRDKIIAITERANIPTVNGRGWRVLEVFQPHPSVMHTRLANQGVEPDTIMYGTSKTHAAQRERLKDKGVSADILAYTFNPTRYDSEPRQWKLMPTKYKSASK